MLKLLPTLVLLLAAFFSSVEGLFVTGIMRPSINPVAAMKSMRQRLPLVADKKGAKPAFLSHTVYHGEEKEENPDITSFGNDDSTRACRSEILELVYSRSLGRMDGFST